MPRRLPTRRQGQWSAEDAALLRWLLTGELPEEDGTGITLEIMLQATEHDSAAPRALWARAQLEVAQWRRQHPGEVPWWERWQQNRDGLPWRHD